MRRISLLALCLSLLPIAGFCDIAPTGSTGPVARPPQPHDVWLIIKDDGHTLSFEDGHLIRFEGRGELEFGPDRRIATVVGSVVVYVDGERVRGERSVRYGETVEFRGDESCWTIQSVVGRFPEGNGTRISDERPDAKASVKSDDGLVFFLQANSQGGADFFYPGANS